MALLGQASGGFTESSSALRLLHVGIRNSVGVLTTDSFTQTNPPNFSADSASASTVSSQADTAVLGVLSGSIAFSRSDAGENYIGGPVVGGTAGQAALVANTDSVLARPLGIFINNAVGNSYENTPGTSSGKGPYVSAQGCYANSLYEDWELGLNGSGAVSTTRSAITYFAGQTLCASANGYLMPKDGMTANESFFGTNSAGTITDDVIGVLKMAPDSTQDELVYDQRI